MSSLWLFPAGLLLLLAPTVMEAARQAVQVFGTSVLPALFPMMVLGGLMGKGLGHSRRRGLLLTVFAFCAGSPAAARQAAILHKCSPFCRDRRIPLLCMTGVMSPMFFVGCLGAGLGNRAGWQLLLCHWAAALAAGAVCAFCCRCRFTGRTGQEAPINTDSRHPAADPTAEGTLRSLPAVIGEAAQALLSVLGAMMLFAILAALLRTLLTGLFPRWAKGNSGAICLLWALLEVGGGSLALLGQGAPPWLLCGLCSFGGLSIWLQNLLFIGHMIRPTELLCWRMLHGALGALFGFIVFHVFPAVPAAAASAPLPVGRGLQLSLLLLTALALPRLRAS